MSESASEAGTAASAVESDDSASEAGTAVTVESDDSASEVGPAASADDTVLSKIEAVLNSTGADDRKWCVDGSVPAIMPALTIAGVGNVSVPLLPEQEQV